MSKEKNAVAKNAERAYRVKQEDLVWNRILVWLGVLALVEIVLLWMAPYMVVRSTSEAALQLTIGFRNAVSVGRWLALAVAVAGGAWGVMRHKTQQTINCQMMMVWIGLATMAGLQVIHLFRETGTYVVCRVVLGIAVLGLVYLLYQRAFFLSGILSGVAILALWLVREADGTRDSLVQIGLMAGIALAVILAVLTGMAQSQDGNLKLGNHSFNLVSGKGDSTVVYLTCAIVAACLGATLAAGVGVAYYLLFVLVAWVFVMAVYFTVKQM